MKSVPPEVAENLQISVFTVCCLRSQTECVVTIGSTNDVIFGVGLLTVAVRGSV